MKAGAPNAQNCSQMIHITLNYRSHWITNHFHKIPDSLWRKWDFNITRWNIHSALLTQVWWKLIWLINVSIKKGISRQSFSYRKWKKFVFVSGSSEFKHWEGTFIISLEVRIWGFFQGVCTVSVWMPAIFKDISFWNGKSTGVWARTEWSPRVCSSPIFSVTLHLLQPGADVGAPAHFVSASPAWKKCCFISEAVLMEFCFSLLAAPCCCRFGWVPHRCSGLFQRTVLWEHTGIILLCQPQWDVCRGLYSQQA